MVEQIPTQKPNLLDELLLNQLQILNTRISNDTMVELSKHLFLDVNFIRHFIKNLHFSLEIIPLAKNEKPKWFNAISDSMREVLDEMQQEIIERINVVVLLIDQVAKHNKHEELDITTRLLQRVADEVKVIHGYDVVIKTVKNGLIETVELLESQKGLMLNTKR